MKRSQKQHKRCLAEVVSRLGSPCTCKWCSIFSPLWQDNNRLHQSYILGCCSRRHSCHHPGSPCSNNHTSSPCIGMWCKIPCLPCPSACPQSSRSQHSSRRRRTGSPHYCCCHRSFHRPCIADLRMDLEWLEAEHSRLQDPCIYTVCSIFLLLWHRNNHRHQSCSAPHCSRHHSCHHLAMPVWRTERGSGPGICTLCSIFCRLYHNSRRRRNRKPRYCCRRRKRHRP